MLKIKNVALPSKRRTKFAADPKLSGPLIAIILGVTEQRVRQLTQEGMPRVGRGRYPLIGCVQWYLAYWKTRALTNEKGHKLKNMKFDLQIQLLKIKVQEKTNELNDRIFVETRRDVLRALRRRNDDLPFVMGKKFNWSRELILAVRDCLDEARNDLERQLEFSEATHDE
jgi:hypothetical protein